MIILIDTYSLKCANCFHLLFVCTVMHDNYHFVPCTGRAMPTYFFCRKWYSAKLSKLTIQKHFLVVNPASSTYVFCVYALVSTKECADIVAVRMHTLIDLVMCIFSVACNSYDD